MAKPETELDEHFRERYLDAGSPEAAARVERAREVVEAMRRYDALAGGEEKERADLGRALGKFARIARLNDQLRDARDAWEDAIEIWRELDRHKAMFLARLEQTVALAESYIAGDETIELAEITRRFEALEARIASDDTGKLSLYEDFVASHRGCWHAGRAEFEEASEHIGRALELRRARGNARHIEQTELLLDRIARSG